MYLRSYGTKPSEQDSFLSRCNQPRVRVREAVLVTCRAKNSFFPLSFSFSFFSFLFFFVLERGTRNIHRDMHCLLREKQWELRFCAEDDVERENRVSSLRRQPSESKTNVFAITAFVTERETWGTRAHLENSFIR